MKIKTFFILFAALFAQSLPGYSASASAPETSGATSVRVSLRTLERAFYDMGNIDHSGTPRADLIKHVVLHCFNSRGENLGTFKRPLESLRPKKYMESYDDRPGLKDLDLGVITISKKDSILFTLYLLIEDDTMATSEEIKFWSQRGLYNPDRPEYLDPMPITNEEGRVLSSIRLEIGVTPEKEIREIYPEDAAGKTEIRVFNTETGGILVHRIVNTVYQTNGTIS